MIRAGIRGRHMMARGLTKRTNLLVQSNTLNQTWTLSNTNTTEVVSPSGVSPDGVNDAWKMREKATTSSTHSVQQNVAKPAAVQPYIFDVFAKASERGRITIQVGGPGLTNGVQATFDMSGMQIGVASAAFGAGWTAGQAVVKSFGNSWLRCGVPVTSDTASTISSAVYIDAGAGTAAANTAFTGTVNSGVLLFGAELKPGSVMSPYIQTVASSASRGVVG